MSARLLKDPELKRLATKAGFHPARLAALYSISTRELQRSFQKKFQTTPGHWLRQLQCELAKELLVRGDSNKVTASKVGFVTEAHFCREFKRNIGTSPQAYASKLSENI